MDHVRRWGLAVLFFGLMSFAAAAPRVFMVGDSTMANKPLDLPERGWGMVLPEYFREPAVVHNHAVNGRSTKSFIDEGRWDKVVGELQAGDFVIIQFGHNDEKKEDPKRYTDPATSYRDNLRRFVRESRAKGATPILATPVCRRKFDANGHLENTHDGYPDAVRAVAAEEHVSLLDLERDTAKWLQGVGDEPSKQFFMWIPAGKYAKLPDGKKDDTHFVEAGARHVAELAIAEMRALKLGIVEMLK
jgi:DNA sulfur modification protein DndE